MNTLDIPLSSGVGPDKKGGDSIALDIDNL
jgi:hypothetical protein